MGVQPNVQPELVLILPRPRWSPRELSSLWRYRGLLYFLVWRDVKVRYKQTLLGVGWVILQPAASLLVFSLLFGRLLRVPTGDVPYPVFAGVGLLPWSYFSSALARCAGSLVASSSVITKVYFPRIVVPLAAVLTPLLDLIFGSLVVGVLLVGYDIRLGLRVLLLPLVIAGAVVTALAFGLWLGALNVRYRDVNHLVPFVLQLWMYGTPVVYGLGVVPEPARSALFLNPLTLVVEASRWCALGQVVAKPPMVIIAVSVALVLATLVGGMVYFHRAEQTFADVV